MVLGSRSEIIWHLGLIFRFLALNKHEWSYGHYLQRTVCCAGWKHRVDVRLISRLSITRHYCDANDGADFCKARRHGNSLLLQRHPVVAWWCLWRLSVQAGETSCQRGISLESVGYLTEQWQHVTTHTGDCTLTPSKVRSLQSVGILAERQSDRL